MRRAEQSARICRGGALIAALALWPVQATHAQSIPIAVVRAAQEFDTRTGEPIVTFQMTPGSRQAFAELTQENVGRKAAIKVDGRALSAPVIRQPILGGQGQIAGHLTLEEARRIAAGLASGTSKMTIEIVSEKADNP